MVVVVVGRGGGGGSVVVAVVMGDTALWLEASFALCTEVKLDRGLLKEKRLHLIHYLIQEQARYYEIDKKVKSLSCLIYGWAHLAPYHPVIISYSM